MKLLALLLFSSLAYASTFDVRTLQVGECAADVFSKKYHPPLPSSDLQFYSCEYTCRESADKLHKIRLKHADSVQRFSEMSGFLCQGVQIEDQVVVGSIKSPAPVVYAFSAFQASNPELVDWLKRVKLSPTPEQKFEFEQKFYQALSSMYPVYKTADSQALVVAGQLLEFIVSGQDGVLKYYLERLRERDWSLRVDYNSADDIVMDAIRNHGRYLDYTF